jgi:hypothetical protein
VQRRGRRVERRGRRVQRRGKREEIGQRSLGQLSPFSHDP